MCGNKSPPSICVAHVWTIFAILTFGEMDLSAWPEISSIALHRLKRGLLTFYLGIHFFSPFKEHKGKNCEIYTGVQSIHSNIHLLLFSLQIELYQNKICNYKQVNKCLHWIQSCEIKFKISVTHDEITHGRLQIMFVFFSIAIIYFILSN